MHARRLMVAAIVMMASGGVAHAEVPRPTGPHPRILLDSALRATWQRQAGQHGAVARAIDRCADARARPEEYDRDSYMGFDWSATLQACLVAWAATGHDADARTAIRYFAALLDDLRVVGDGSGGERAVRRDTGYAIRMLPPNAALAYDWLHDHPAMTPALRARARLRFAQWLGWYMAEGYHRRSPGTNYHAGYTVAATLVAVATAGETPELDSTLWREVSERIWATDMARALAPGGVLDGGEFPEGWQYGPLSVAEYALAARVAHANGIATEGVERWLGAIVVRTVHAMSERDTIFAVGDTEAPTPSLPVPPMALAAVLVGDAPAAAWPLAASEMARLRLSVKDYPLYDALIAAREVAPHPIERARWPTSYFTGGTLYARTSWRADGVWLAMRCQHGLDVDHAHPDAGNLVLTRGLDELLIDPSPYGSMSSLTGNAPTIDSAHFPAEYRPSQAYWGEDTRFAWAEQTRSGVIAARCDYADQFKFQERASDVPFAQRDVIVVPWGEHRADATAIVIDRASSGTASRAMYLRFRAPGLAGRGDVARARVGASTLTITRVRSTGGTPQSRAIAIGECYDTPHTCEAARLPTGEYRLVVPGPNMEAVHVLDAAATPDLVVERLAGAADVLHLRRGGADAYVALAAVATYAVPAGPSTHVLALPGTHDAIAVAARRSGERCELTIGAGGVAIAAHPAVFQLDASCNVIADPPVGPAAPTLDGSGGALIPVGGVAGKRASGRGGCCAASADDDANLFFGSLAMMFVIAIISRSRRRADSSTKISDRESR